MTVKGRQRPEQRRKAVARLGVLIVVGVLAYQAWTPLLDAVAPFLAPLVAGG